MPCSERRSLSPDELNRPKDNRLRQRRMAREVSRSIRLPEQTRSWMGMRDDRMPEGCTVVIFGASGDLTRRKLVPALLDLARQGVLPPGFTIVGVARTEMTDEGFREHLHKSLQEFGEITGEESGLWSTFSQAVRYLSMDPSKPEEYDRLRSALEEIASSRGVAPNVLFYLSTPPNLYAPIVRALGGAGLQNPAPGGSWVRVIIEKPFGIDLDSARQLNREILGVFHEEQIYRIDHYLGKETVQNLVAFRFANGIFEPIWNRNYIDHIQITAAETVGVEGRGGYYEQAGALRDMVQNHMMQLLALTAMEPPVLFDARQVRDEKQKVFTAIRPIPPEEVHRYTVRGQYASGAINGKSVPGYRQEKGVASDSTTETYVALRLTIDNWRWADVPFFDPGREASPQARHGDCRAVQKDAAPSLCTAPGGTSRAQCYRDPHPARRGDLAPLQLQSPGLGHEDAARDDGLPLRLIFRASALGCLHPTPSGLHARRCHALCPRGQRGGGLGVDYACPRGLDGKHQCSGL